jgi:hypothetical protein
MNPGSIPVIHCPPAPLLMHKNDTRLHGLCDIVMNLSKDASCRLACC